MICFTDCQRGTQLAFPLSAFLGQDMASKRLSAFELSATGAFETLCRTAVIFQFWHLELRIVN
jgi:hypothetical protein|tara:strand:- start:2503 stop:2691 length:189 start_codon:yes stop_codon:yes gene_type:complete